MVKKSRIRIFLEFFRKMCLLQISDDLPKNSQQCCKMNINIQEKITENCTCEEFCDSRPICSECYHFLCSDCKPRRLFRLYPLPTRFHLKSKRFAETSRPIFHQTKSQCFNYDS